MLFLQYNKNHLFSPTIFPLASILFSQYSFDYYNCDFIIIINMSFFSKVVEKKGLLIAAVGATLAIGAALYLHPHLASIKATKIRIKNLLVRKFKTN